MGFGSLTKSDLGPGPHLPPSLTSCSLYHLPSASRQTASRDGPLGSPSPTASLTKHGGPELDKGWSRSAQEPWDGRGAPPGLGSPGQCWPPMPSNHWVLCCMQMAHEAHTYVLCLVHVCAALTTKLA